MPTIDRLEGMKINIYNGDHHPPHIHVLYNEYEVLIEIESLEICASQLPRNKLKHILHWLKENAEWCKKVFYELNPEFTCDIK